LRKPLTKPRLVRKNDALPKDIFNAQEEITRRIVGTLAVRVSSLEAARLATTPASLPPVKAWRCWGGRGRQGDDAMRWQRPCAINDEAANYGGLE